MPKRLNWLDESIDEAAVDGRKTIVSRLAAAAVHGSLVGLNLGWAIGLFWFVIDVVFEGFGWATTRRQAAGEPGSRWDRLRYLLSVFAMTSTWVTGTALYWFTHAPALQIVSIVMLTAQLVHAQAFTFRSRAVLLINGGLPSLALIGLPVLFGGYSGIALVTVLFGAVTALGYVWSSARSNATTASVLLMERRKAEAANRAKSAFLAMISHELRTPLNGVLGMAQALKLTGLSERQDHCARAIIGCGDDLLVLLNDILDLSKIEAGKLELDQKAFALDDVVQSVVDLWAQSAEAKGVRLSATWCEAPRWVEGDPLRVKQVLLNLVSNALKFTNEGEIALVVDTVKDASDRHLIEISVHDTGIGMTPAQQTRLFEDYVQAESSTAAQFGGTGLGLSICRRLSTLMGGTITVESEAGRGSVFRVQLALAACDSDLASERPSADMASLAGRRILVVDDNVHNRAVAVAILTAVDAIVETAEDAIQALDCLRWNKFDLVLTDLHMPGMTGIEMTQRIRKGEAGPPGIAIVALTGDVDLPPHDFDAVQSKPIQAARLLAVMAEQLAKQAVPPHKIEVAA